MVLNGGMQMKYSEEEKKAIRDLRNNIQFGLIGDGTSLITNETAGIILNLIEKQQKEIENSISKDKIREINKNTDNRYDFAKEILKLIGE
jgi:hypothetical protein